MAPSAQPYQQSHATLEALYETLGKHEITLPERPQNTADQTHYLDRALDMLGTSTKYLCDSTDKQFAELRNDVQRVDKRVERVDKRVDIIDQKLEKFMQFGINSMRRYLDDVIQPIPAPVRVGDEERYTAAEDFPETVRDFWALASDPAALARLARHYSIRGWERWKRHGSDDSDATEYDSLENAITAHRDKCLRMLASMWGLEYTNLERPNYDTQQKRKATTDGSSSRRVRAREETEGDDKVESIISRSENGEVFRQDRIIRMGPQIPVTARDVWRNVIENPPRQRNRRVSFDSAVLGWRIGSESTEHHRVHDA